MMGPPNIKDCLWNVPNPTSMMGRSRATIYFMESFSISRPMSLSSCFKPSGEHVAVLIPFSVVDDQLHDFNTGSHLELQPHMRRIST